MMLSAREAASAYAPGMASTLSAATSLLPQGIVTLTLCMAAVGANVPCLLQPLRLWPCWAANRRCHPQITARSCR